MFVNRLPLLSAAAATRNTSPECTDVILGCCTGPELTELTQCTPSWLFPARIGPTEMLNPSPGMRRQLAQQHRHPGVPLTHISPSCQLDRAGSEAFEIDNLHEHAVKEPNAKPRLTAWYHTMYASLPGARSARSKLIGNCGHRHEHPVPVSWPIQRRPSVCFKNSVLSLRVPRAGSILVSPFSYRAIDSTGPSCQCSQATCEL